MASDSDFYEDMELGNEEHLKFFAEKEERRQQFMSAELIAKYGLGAREVVNRAIEKILADREERVIKNLEEIFVEKYGDEAHDIVAKARPWILFQREPVNMLTLAEFATEAYGQEAIEVMMEGNRKMWVERSKMLIDELNIEGRDCIAAIKIISYVHRGGMGKVIESSPNRVVREEYWCPFLPIWGDEWDKRINYYSQRGMCDAINPDIEIKIEQFQREGDTCLRIVYELEGQL